MRAIICLVAALLLNSPAVQAANWFALDSSGAAGSVGVEVDTDSLRQSQRRRAVSVRVSYPEPRLHLWGAWFRSMVATVEFECEGQLAGYRDAIFYSETKGRGIVMAREEGRLAGITEGTRELL